MQEQSIGITGMGIISSIGNTVEENLEALLSKKKGIGKITHINTIHKNDILVGEVKLSNAELLNRLKYPKNKALSRTALLGCIASQEAIKNAGIDTINDYETGLISATSVGGMDTTEMYFNTFHESAKNRSYIKEHQAGNSTEHIANNLGITDFISTISTACSSAANAIMLGCRLIKSGKLDRVIVGGTDALSKFTINGFKSLLILSDRECAPFDANRNGLNLGEAAAFLVLESEKIIQTKNKPVLAYVSGYGNANDAHHQTASSENGEGAFQAMKLALKTANMAPKSIDYVNVHGTATPNNDLSEGNAMLRLFNNNVPDFSSTKAYTGHTLAAAGAIEAVFSVLALQNKIMFPNLNFKTTIPELQLTPITALTNKPLTHVLSNSFGFGGNCSTLIFSKTQ